MLPIASLEYLVESCGRSWAASFQDLRSGRQRMPGPRPRRTSRLARRTDDFTAAGQLRFVQQAVGNRTLVEGNVDADLAADSGSS